MEVSFTQDGQGRPEEMTFSRRPGEKKGVRCADTQSSCIWEVGALMDRALNGFPNNSKGSVAGDERVRAQWEDRTGEPSSWKHMRFMLRTFDFIMNEMGRWADLG